jgi:sugar lactone lactonase YvrE
MALSPRTVVLFQPTDLGGGSAAPTRPRVEEVAQFAHQVTGVTVSETGRIFVNFPRWSEDTAVSVAELGADGSLTPYPDAKWNSWRNAAKWQMSAADHWVCVQSVVADGRGNLFVLDPAAPAQAQMVEGGPKLVRIDLASNAVAQIIAFDPSMAPQGSYLNDVRLSPDGAAAFITDSGAKGALLVVDLRSGATRRVLDGHPSTQVEPDIDVTADGEVLRRPDGRGIEFSADGIALSNDGAWLYWQAIKGETLYRIPTAALLDEKLSADALTAEIEEIGTNGVADGLLIDSRGRMIITAPQDNALRIREANGEPRIWVQDNRLRWPDTLTQGPDGTIYVTTSRIMDMSWFKPDSPDALPTTLWRIVE